MSSDLTTNAPVSRKKQKRSVLPGAQHSTLPLAPPPEDLYKQIDYFSLFADRTLNSRWSVEPGQYLDISVEHSIFYCIATLKNPPPIPPTPPPTVDGASDNSEVLNTEKIEYCTANVFSLSSLLRQTIELFPQLVHGRQKSLSFWIMNPRCNVQIYQSGVIQCQGLRNLCFVNEVLWFVQQLLFDTGYTEYHLTRVTLRNIVLSFRLPGTALDINRMAKENPGICRKNPKFTGVHYKPFPHMRLTATMFENCNVSVVGVKHIPDFEQFMHALVTLVPKYLSKIKKIKK